VSHYARCLPVCALLHIYLCRVSRLWAAGRVTVSCPGPPFSLECSSTLHSSSPSPTTWARYKLSLAFGVPKVTGERGPCPRADRLWTSSVFTSLGQPLISGKWAERSSQGAPGLSPYLCGPCNLGQCGDYRCVRWGRQSAWVCMEVGHPCPERSTPKLTGGPGGMGPADSPVRAWCGR
jgi:hypothetical protein